MGFWSKLFSFGKKECDCAPCNCDPCECGDNWKDVELTEADKQTLKNIDEKIVVGKVVSVEAHPNPKMTKVRVAQVSFGDEPVQILCGGVNLEVGQTVPVATVGAKLSEDFEISVRDIRGVTSHGMICARAELGISLAGEQKGEIWILPQDFGHFLGKSLKKI